MQFSRFLDSRSVGTWAVASVLAAMVLGSAQAQIYRCERDGKLAFSDQPCEKGAKETQKRYATSATRGELDSQLAVSHYPVQGGDYAALAASLKANGPKGFHGLANWGVNYEYTTERQRDACWIAAVRVKIKGDILMPRWTDEASAPSELQRRWAIYYAALKRHEDGHVHHGKELALLLKAWLMGLGTMPCDQIPAVAKKEFERLYESHKTLDQEYDARTSHGATQGAVF